MAENKKKKKQGMKIHPRNQHVGSYDLAILSEKHPPLKEFIQPNIYGHDSIEFANPLAVKALNTALLLNHYNLEYWDIPEGYLCPPIPGRADYIHHIADLFASYNFGNIPTGSQIKGLDIGTGANLVYPIIGNHEYGWSFITSDINEVALASAQTIIDKNSVLKDEIVCKLQPNKKRYLYNILEPGDIIDFAICNPPFHASKKDAKSSAKRKVKNLTGEVTDKPVLNFSGQPHELWYPGGEKAFITNYILESKRYKKQCFWFTSLVSKSTNLKSLKIVLRENNALEYKVIPMGQGNKSSSLLAWTFLSKPAQNVWKTTRWKVEEEEEDTKE